MSQVCGGDSRTLLKHRGKASTIVGLNTPNRDICLNSIN
jgi:hypothetical protein